MQTLKVSCQIQNLTLVGEVEQQGSMQVRERREPIWVVIWLLQLGTSVQSDPWCAMRIEGPSLHEINETKLEKTKVFCTATSPRVVS